jgi:hypothetical protein
LEQVRIWLPVGAKALLSADRFYPSVALFAWLKQQGGDYRLRVKGNLEVDTGMSHEATTGELARGVKERYLSGVRLFAAGVSTNLGILHEAGHPEPWIIAMNSVPTRAAVLDYGARGGSSRCSRISRERFLVGRLVGTSRALGAADFDHGVGEVLVCRRGSGRGGTATDTA